MSVSITDRVEKMYMDTRTLSDPVQKLLPITIRGIDYFPKLTYEYSLESLQPKIHRIEFSLTDQEDKAHFAGEKHYETPRGNFEVVSTLWSVYLHHAETRFSKQLMRQFLGKDINKMYDSLKILVEDQILFAQAVDRLTHLR